jgi:HK97 family phage portal protein
MGFILENGLAQPIAPQAFAETAPLFFNGYFVPHQGLQLETRYATYAQIYAQSTWVATVVDAIAKNIARLQMTVWDTSPADGNVLKPPRGEGASSYAKLMANPCPTMHPHQFREWLASTFEIYGEAFLIKVKNGDDYTRNTVVDGKRVQVSSNTGKTVGMIPMHPALTQIFRDQYGDLTYRFMGQPNELISEDMVVPFVRYNPETAMRGLSRLEALRSTITNEDAIRRAYTSFWRHNLRPSAVMHVEGKLNPEAKLRLQEQLSMMYSGAENVGKVPILENGSKLETLQNSATEMQYIDARKIDREEVCSRFDLSPVAVHILEHATLTNVTEELIGVYRDSICPRLEFFESGFNYYVGSEFNGQQEMRYDTRRVMRGDPVQRAQMHTMLIQSGVETPEEARPEFDLGASGDPAAAKLYHQQQLVPLDTPPARTALPPGQSDSHDGGEQVSTTAAGGGSGPAVPSVAGRKYIGDIKSLMGLGKSLPEAIGLLHSRNPHDADAIREAHHHFAERIA